MKNIFKYFIRNIRVYKPYQDYKPFIAIQVDNPGIYTSEKILILCSGDNIRLKCDVVDGIVVNGLRQQVLYSFILDELSGYKVFCQPETTHFKK